MNFQIVVALACLLNIKMSSYAPVHAYDWARSRWRIKF